VEDRQRKQILVLQSLINLYVYWIVIITLLNNKLLQTTGQWRSQDFKMGAGKPKILKKHQQLTIPNSSFFC
jgi:hypothetical protein